MSEFVRGFVSGFREVWDAFLDGFNRAAGEDAK